MLRETNKISSEYCSGMIKPKKDRRDRYQILLGSLRPVEPRAPGCGPEEPGKWAVQNVGCASCSRDGPGWFPKSTGQFWQVTPNRVRHNLDLTLRLNSTPSPAGDDATMNAMTRHYRRTGFICRLKATNLPSKPMNIW
jgi:hypothetical protein